jgi:hypothetical protein
MKRWAVLVVALYLLILSTLTIPLVVGAFYPTVTVTMPKDMHDLMDTIGVWQYWVFLGVMTAAQAVMLVVPVDLSIGRPASRRSVLWTVLASGLMMGVLGAGAAFSIDEFFRRDKAGRGIVAALPWAILLVVWAVWSLAFYRASRGAAAMDVVTRQCRSLLKGSILELLIAVPTHIVARARDYCCAGFYTFLGIVFGVAVMLFSFGPGVFFLFMARWKRVHPQSGGLG